jgi:hypothetical protein
MSSKSRIIYLSFAVAILGGALTLLLLRISEARVQASEAYAEALSLTGNDSWTKGVKMIRSESTGDLATLGDVSITQPELIGLIESLEEIGKKMGLKVTFSSIASEATGSSTTPTTVKMVVDTEGAWAASLAFVNLLQNLPVKSSIEGTSINLSKQVWRTGTTFRVTVFPEDI